MSPPPAFNCSESHRIIGAEEQAAYDLLTLEFNYFSRVEFWVSLVCIVLFVLAFLLFKRASLHQPLGERIRKRKSILVALSALGALCFLFLGPFQTVVGYEVYPCWIQLILLFSIVPLVGGSVVHRLFLFISHGKVARGAAFLGKNSPGDEESSDYSSVITLMSFLGAMSYVKATLFALGVALGIKKLNPSNSQHIEALALATTNSGALLIGALFYFPFFITSMALIATDPVYTHGCSGCVFSDLETGLVAGETVVVVCLGTIIACRARHDADPWGLMRECSWSLFGMALAFLGFMLDAFSGYDKTKGMYDHLFLACFGLALVVFAQTIGVIIQSLADEKKRNRIIADELRRPSTVGINLEVILGDAKVLQEFEEHLVRELAVETLHFVLAVDAWKKGYSDMNPATRASRAKRIANLYLFEDSTYQVNFPYQLISRYTQMFREHTIGDITKIQVTVFDDARTEAVNLLERGAMLRFLAHNREHVVREIGAYATP